MKTQYHPIVPKQPTMTSKEAEKPEDLVLVSMTQNHVYREGERKHLRIRCLMSRSEAELRVKYMEMYEQPFFEKKIIMLECQCHDIDHDRPPTTEIEICGGDSGDCVNGDISEEDYASLHDGTCVRCGMPVQWRALKDAYDMVGKGEKEHVERIVRWHMDFNYSEKYKLVKGADLANLKQRNEKKIQDIISCYMRYHLADPNDDEWTNHLSFEPTRADDINALVDIEQCLFNLEDKIKEGIIKRETEWLRMLSDVTVCESLK